MGTGMEMRPCPRRVVQHLYNHHIWHAAPTRVRMFLHASYDGNSTPLSQKLSQYIYWITLLINASIQIASIVITTLLCMQTASLPIYEECIKHVT